MIEVMEYLQNGVRVNLYLDVESAILLSFALFFALILALTFYAKVIT